MNRGGEGKRQSEADSQRWHRDRSAHVAKRDVDEAAGREIFASSIKSGTPIKAQTTSDLRVLGAEARKPAASAEPEGVSPVTVSELVVAGRRPNSVADRISGPARAGGSGFVDEFTFGAADPVLAAGDAWLHGGFRGWRERYRGAMQTKRMQDAYDEAHYGAARNVGRVAGLGASVALMGLPAVERMAVRFLPGGAKIADGLRTSKYALDRRGLAKMAAAGGMGAGVVSQAVSDDVTGRQASAGDYVASGLGGMVDGLATLALGPGAGGAAGGATTTALQEVLNARRPTVDQLIDSAHRSAAFGQVAGAGASYVAGGLRPLHKGRLGELMTDIKTIARGDGIPFNQGKRFGLAKGGHTFTDSQFHPSGDLETIGINEGKLGPYATIRPRQEQAMRQLGPNYVLDGWRFSDVGKAVGATSSTYGTLYDDEQDRAWNGR